MKEIEAGVRYNGLRKGSCRRKPAHALDLNVLRAPVGAITECYRYTMDSCRMNDCNCPRLPAGGGTHPSAVTELKHEA